MDGGSHVSVSENIEAKSDLVNVLGQLESHWVVLEAEVVEVNKDIAYCEQCLHKYGDYFAHPLQNLKVDALLYASALTE